MFRNVITLIGVAIFACASTLEAQLALFIKQSPVPTITVSQLRQCLFGAQVARTASRRESVAPDFVLVDVREAEERAVSLIPGAISVEQFEEAKESYRNRTVIAYCTVGARSERYTRRLIADGVNALNFESSILGWCKAKLPLVTPEGKPTNRVHTYSARFSKVPARYVAVH